MSNPDQSAVRRTTADRLRFWRSPDGQPAWARPLLLGIAAVAAVLYGWRIRDSGYALYYSIAVKSMSVSWPAFWYGALDPGATITIDKLAGSFLPQALSARIFGYHAWALTLPQVIEGVVAVLAMYRIGRRWVGPTAGLLAAGLFGLTPVIASMFGHPMEDGLLTMCLVLAADAATHAIRHARLRSLLLAGVWVGLGFQAKMLQAWMILPAVALAYLLAAPTTLRRRLGHLAAAGAVTLAVSLSWIALYTVTPAADRPYIDGSTTNSAAAMVFGYNGTDRFGLHWPGAMTPMTAGATSGKGGLEPPAGFTPPAGADLPGGPGGPDAAGPPGAGPDGGGWTKLGSARYATQIGWLYPLAGIALAAGLWRTRRAPRTDPARAGYLLWGAWLGTFVAVFSAMTLPHTAYLASLAPAVAALTAAGIVHAWRTYQTRTGRWLLPTMVAAELAWTGYLSARYPTFLPWLVWPALGLGAAAVLTVAVTSLRDRRTAPAPASRNRRPRPALIGAATAGAVAAALAVPTAWAVSVLHPDYSGSAFDAAAGPAGGPLTMAGPPGGAAFAAGGPQGTATLTTDQQRLLTYLRQHRNGARYLAATDSWNTAAPYITATGERLLPVGGFSGTAPSPTLDAFTALIRTGQLRFVLLSPAGLGGFPMPGRAGPGTPITTWAKANCTAVSATEYGGSGPPTAGPSEPAGPGPLAGTPGAGPMARFGTLPPALYQCGG
ncbi:ArnT family glycosyltransferase [Dactylosporangium matsuzakiense]|uniref:Glycosyl transferase n=1 Tax=Dactylosporangium matsuzakiense TaxID=53360 RepID=A0A9W6KJP6_9ACTN|nr:glycosyltransferase family 39 protein [Dactylosporangium matsuzakiense]UWZ43145.1 glycosyltransferase family 39 protein [Dactylosporangium matsuzakiense]GLL02768.1 glycosyl transferase [Dactylosporangium matsuzakiense]